MNIFQMMRGCSPQQFMQQIMSNNQMINNPMIKNAAKMAQNGDTSGIEEMARNLCKEKGLNADDLFSQMKNRFM